MDCKYAVDYVGFFSNFINFFEVVRSVLFSETVYDNRSVIITGIFHCSYIFPFDAISLFLYLLVLLSNSYFLFAFRTLKYLRPGSLFFCLTDTDTKKG